MSQCVPSWDLDENYPNNCRAPLRSRSNSTAPDVPMLELDYEVAELTWKNGQLAMHGLGPPRLPAKAAANNPSPTKNTCSGTLESIVNQATSLPQAQRDGKPPLLDEFATAPCWFHQQRPSMATMDALVPCSNRRSEDRTTPVMDPAPRVGGTRSTRVGSCSGPVPLAVPDSTKEDDVLNGKRARVARVPVAPEWSSRDQSFSGSATFGRESQRVSVTHDTYEMDMDMGAGFTGTSMGSPENTSSAKQGNKATTTDDHDSVCHSRPLREAGDEEYKKKGNGKSTISTKRSRAAAIHNQSERKRRDKINQRMKTLQKLVPNSSKTDKASMLDEVIEYLKQLQAQVQVMSRMNMPPMMLPMAMQQQLQMSMLSSMGMGMGVMDMNSMSRPNITGMPPLLHPFLPLASWDGLGDRLQASPLTDPLSTFLACQPQAASMDAYNRMAAMYQQMQQQQQPPASSSKS